MQIKKWIATGLSALMAGATIAGAGLAATSLKDFPGFLASKTATTSALDAFVVVGADAKPSDVVGAVDLAARLAELSYTVETLTGATPTGFVGIDKDGIGIGTASGGALLSAGGDDYSNPFSGGAIVKNFNWPGLKDSTYSWRSTNYDFSEQISVGGVRIRHDTATSGVNGTLTMEVESADIIYQYVFDKTLSGTGDSTTKNYTYPINIEMLGKPFSIVGTDADKVVMLSGSVGTIDATKGVTYGDYTAYATLGSNNAWAKVVIQDKASTTVDTLVINEGDTKTSTVSSLDVKVTDVRALQDGTIIGADVVVGLTGQTEKEYDTSADTTSTGTASDRFPGTTDWGIRAASANFTSGNRGTLQSARMMEVVYQPTSTQYTKTGGSVKLPNNYGELSLVGFGTDKIATITIEQVTGKSVLNSTDNTVGSNLNGLKISSVDEKGNAFASILAANGNAYKEAYVLFGKQLGTGASPYPVYFAFPNAAGNLKTADTNITLTNQAALGDTTSSGSQTNPSNIRIEGAYVIGNTSLVTSEFAWLNLNTSSHTATYSYRLSYGGSGEKSNWRLNVTVGAGGGAPLGKSDSIIGNVTAGDPGNFNLRFGFTNKTKWDTQTTPEFRLGSTTASSESAEVNSTQEGTVREVGKLTQDVIDDNGLIALATDSNGAADKVKIKVAAKELTARVKLGKEGGEAPTLGTVNKIAAITSAVAKLDTEVTTAEKAKHLVLVGGPAVNRLAAEALGKTYPAKGAASGITENTAIIQAVDDIFAKGKVALVVAGWEADNTRIATSVLQNYGVHLKGVVGSKVTITGTAAIPIVKEG